MIYNKPFPLILFSLLATVGYSQKLFGDRCIGNWKGMMHIYQFGHLRDSVEVKLTVERLPEGDNWKWRMEYLSVKMPMVKDYILRLKDKQKNLYVTDEGDGLELTDYLTDNKLYSVFETQGVMLTSSYELIHQELIFEVSSGKKEDSKHPDVNTYSTRSVQRVVFKKQK